MLAAGGEPSSHDEALASDHPLQWCRAEKAEMDNLIKLGVLKWVPADQVPQTAKYLKTKMVYKYKESMPGVPARFKCRLVCKGFMESKYEYGDSFAQVVRHETVRAFFAAAAANDEDMCSVDIVSAFCTAPINRTVYISEPAHFKRPGYVCMLGANMYGLVSAPSAYHKDFDKFLKSCMIHPDPNDTCLYTSSNPLYPNLQLIEYVDDLIIKSSKAEIARFKQDLIAKYEIRDYGEPRSFLGMEIVRDRKAKTIRLTQKAYIQQMAKVYGLLDSHPVDTPMTQALDQMVDGADRLPNASEYRKLVGSLMYCHAATRFDITHAVSQLSRRLTTPSMTDFKAAKRVLQYLYHSQEIGPKYYGSGPTSLVGYSDADYAGDLATRRSTSGRIFMLCDGPISWASKQQRSTSTSTAQAEYIALSQAAAECLWLRKVCATILHVPEMPTTNILEDNTAALKWCYNPINHGKQKHIPVAYHFVREQVTEFNNINVVAVSTEFQLADLYTKCLPAPRFKFLVDSIRGLNPAPQVRRTPSAFDTAKDTIRDAVESVISLKDRLKSMPQRDPQPFFDQHFQEPDPQKLQAQTLSPAA